MSAEIIDAKDLFKAKKEVTRLERKRDNSMGKTGKDQYTHERALTLQKAQIEFNNQKDGLL